MQIHPKCCLDSRTRVVYKFKDIGVAEGWYDIDGYWFIDGNETIYIDLYIEVCRDCGTKLPPRRSK